MNKYSSLTILFFFAAFCAQAKKLVDGYIITSGNDTVRCEIVLPTQFQNRYDMYRQVEVIDNNRRHTTYYAKDRTIAGFGFDYEGKLQSYTLRREGIVMLFEYREMTGKRLNLYSYCTPVSCGVGSPARTKVYVIESRTLDVINIHTGLFSVSKKNIREFLYNDSDLIPLFDGLVSRFSDIRDFIAEANKMI